MLPAGAALGQYTLEAELAAGPFGAVYRAVDASGFRVVIKLFSLETTDPDERAAWAGRIEAEASAAASLEHENVVRVHEVGRAADGRPYVVRDFIVGEPLATYAADGRPELLSRKVHWLLDYARVISHLHERGALHRGIKPKNALVRRDGALRVLGHGVAHRSIDRAAGVVPPSSRFLNRGTPTPRVVGHAAYLAPEQLGHRPVGPAADQFAWGVTAYEVLTGELPWGRHDKPVRVVEAVLTKEPPPLVAYRPYLPPALDGILRRCLAKPESARFPSMAEVAAALGAVRLP